MTDQQPVFQSHHERELVSTSVEQTDSIGQRLGQHLRAGDLLLLLGDIGAGKTHLTKGIVRGLGSQDLVTSPTFVLINEYHSDGAHGNVTIYHADLYRIEQPDELLGIGLEEAWSGTGICLIEWAERAANWLPTDHLTVYLSYLSETERAIRLVPHGARYVELVKQFEDTEGPKDESRRTNA